MNGIEMEIHSTLKNLCPPLTEEEGTNLEESLIREGCRDPLVVCRAKDELLYLLDGFNRHEKCERLNIPYNTHEITLDNGMTPQEWIMRNQLGRRNLNTAWRAKFAVELKKILEEQAKERQGNRTDLDSNIRPNSARSDEEAGKAFGVGKDTVQKAERIMKKATASQKAKWEAGEISTNALDKEIKEGDIELTEEDRLEASQHFEKIRKPKKKTKPVLDPDATGLIGYGKWLVSHIELVGSQQKLAPVKQQDEFHWKMHTLRFCRDKVKDFKRNYMS